MSRLALRVLSAAFAGVIGFALSAASLPTLDAAASASPPSNNSRARRGRAPARGARASKPKPKCPAQPFVSQCALPFKSGVTPADHPIDQQCPLQGNCHSGDGSLLQNEIKNNYCAMGTPVKIGVATIDNLQKDVDALVKKKQLTYGVGNKPPLRKDRPKLHNLETVDAKGNPITLSEGALVTYEGFVFEAKHDDTFPLGFKGEGVNCNNPALDFNDIHIALVETSDIINADECDSVTAEIIPHSRPDLWDRFDSNANTKKFVANPLPVVGLRIRVTGQLFFDGSHRPRPCAGPRRRSSWEVHPVYGIEVFDSGGFITLEKWAAKHHF